VVPYLVLEWLEGESLADDFKNRRERGQRGRPLEEVVPMFGPVAQALDYAHKRGVVHRDVKPGNLFLAKRDGSVRLKVLDFGTAKILDGTLGITVAQTHGNTMVCSPRYAAPEQFDTKLGPVGAWTDLYSLAIVMFEALRDRRVRPSERIGACMTEALDPAKPVCGSALGLTLPARVDLVLSRAAALDPKARPQSIAEFWDELTSASKQAS
jgi:serine/threonine protein kinase